MQRAAARRASPAAAVTAKSLSSAPSLLSLLCVLSASAAAGHLADITIDTGRRRSCRQPPPTRQRSGHYHSTTPCTRPPNWQLRRQIAGSLRNAAAPAPNTPRCALCTMPLTAGRGGAVRGQRGALKRSRWRSAVRLCDGAARRGAVARLYNGPRAAGGACCTKTPPLKTAAARFSGCDLF